MDPMIFDIEREYGTPFYIFDEDRFAQNFRRMNRAFQGIWPDLIMGYSFKTNYIPHICALAKSLGACAEVVSRMELEIALKLRFPAERIIFNGPVKTDGDVRMALERGILVNTDSFAEVEEICRYARESAKGRVFAGVRVNVGLLDEEGQSHIQEKLPSGRFGFSGKDIGEISEMFRDAGVEVLSLHGHTSSSSREAWVYETITRTLCDAARDFFPDTVKYINVGGGFFGHVPEEMGFGRVPSFTEYAEAVGGVLRRHSWAAANRPVLVIEPGMCLVADCQSFFTRVHELKSFPKGPSVAVVDGSILNVKPTFHARNLPFQVLVRAPREDKSTDVYNVVGSTCMEKDFLLRNVESVRIERGDLIRIDAVGAYTNVLNPAFIHPIPPVIARSGDRFRLIRRRQTFDDFVAGCTF